MNLLLYTFLYNGRTTPDLGLHAKSVLWLDSTHLRITYDWTDDNQLLDWTGINCELSRNGDNVVVGPPSGNISAMSWSFVHSCTKINASNVMNLGTSAHLNVYTNLSTIYSGEVAPNPALGFILGGGAWVVDNWDNLTPVGPSLVQNHPED